MVHSQVKFSADERLQQSPETLLSWLKAVQVDESGLPSDFNWLGLAQGTALRANQQCEAKNRQLSLQWGKIAIALYQQLSGSVPSSEADAFEQSEMNLRVNLIRAWGQEPEHEILDARTICNWFFERLPFSLSEAVKQAKPWQDPQIFRDPSYVAEHMDDLRRLRYLKNHLNIVERLLDLEDWQADSELEQWCELKSKLP